MAIARGWGGWRYNKSGISVVQGENLSADGVDAGNTSECTHNFTEQHLKVVQFCDKFYAMCMLQP